MSSNANKNASEKALASYFSDMSCVQVPSAEQEAETFRKLLSVETLMVARFLEDRDSEAQLRRASLGEEDNKLPARVWAKSGLHPGVIRFVRLTDSGREWFHDRTQAALKAKDKKISALNDQRERIKNGFVAANLRLTVMVAKRYSRHCRHQTFGDLIQEGNLGLMRAVDRFDPDRGFKFATYAVWWIRHHVKRAVSDKEGPIRIPVHVAELSQKLSRLEGGYLAETGTAMNVEQLARAAKVPVEKVVSVLASRQRVVHLDAPVGEEENMSFLDTLASDAFPDPLDSLCSAEAREELLSLLSGLRPFESRVIRHRFGMDGPNQLTLQEIAERYDLSRERIRQIESIALKKLRSRMGARKLTEYLSEAV